MWIGFAAIPAAGERAEPPVAATAWYWEDKQSQEFTLPDGSKVVVETPNPFCPGPGGGLGEPSQTCADGRLPVEIQGGDYKTPNKLSAVQFDLFTVPVGSTVTEFTVTFLEAKAGCYDTGNPPPSNVQCEQTDPINIEGKKLQACVVNEIFGEGDSRQYKEIPKFTCSPSDPVAKRKEVKPKGNDPDAEPKHVWTFDLTPFAQQWVEKFTVATSIMITGAAPKEAGSNDNWRVVLAGPRFKNGVVTKLTYEPPPGAGGGGGGTDTGITTTTTDFGTTGTDFGTSTTDFGTTDGGGTPTTDDGTTPVDAGEDPGDDPGEQAAELQDPVGMPWYMVAAILLGIVGFSLVRRAVIEAATGIRPDGVLAQIRSINAQRKGVTAAEVETAGAFAGVAAAIRSFGSRVSTIGSRVSTTTGKLFRKGRT
jgi:hypothetical protein